MGDYRYFSTHDVCNCTNDLFAFRYSLVYEFP